MNRRVRMLCLVFLVAGALLFVAGAWADEVPLALTYTGSAVPSGMAHFPNVDVYVFRTVDQPAPPAAVPFDIVRFDNYFTVDLTTGLVTVGRGVFVTAGGDVLYTRLTGQMIMDSANTFHTPVTLEFVGGTGVFAGARGGGTAVSHEVMLPSGLVEVVSGEVDATVILADLPLEMVPMRASQGDLVSLDQVQPVDQQTGQPLPWLFQKDVHTGLATHCGAYSNYKLSLIDLTTGRVVGYYTKTTANGDTMDGYFEGYAWPSAEYEGAMEASLQSWIMTGTGRFENVSGKEVLTGLIWLDGTEMVNLDGVISSVGSSMD